jgi:methionyl-tRNA synthetase
MFTWLDLQAKQNNELLKNLGNFVHRTLSFLAKPIGFSPLHLHCDQSGRKVMISVQDSWVCVVGC